MFADWARGDWTTVVPLFDPDVRFRTIQPEGPIEARGPDGVAGFMRPFLAAWVAVVTEGERITRLELWFEREPAEAALRED